MKMMKENGKPVENFPKKVDISKYFTEIMEEYFEEEEEIMLILGDYGPETNH